MIQVKINGQSVEVPPGTTVLQATRLAGIEIPTLCDHPSLKPYGGCRLCVVEVEGMRTLQASCTLPVFQNMVVSTDTPKVRRAREFVLTLLFSERNHFCMYCQKSGGDCELQNAAYGENMTHWPLQPNWKPFAVDASHPYIAIDHNRCILCRRCVRACAELVGNATLDIENRGANSLLTADSGLPLGESSCISCGVCQQVCPTGALIDRESAYLGLDQAMQRVESICLGCSVGCGVDLIVRDNRLVRIDGRWDAPVNAGVLCQTGRYEALEDGRKRIETPLVRKNGTLQPATWDEALSVVAERITPLKGMNGSGVAAMASTRLPAEALWAFKNLFAGYLGSSMVTSQEEDQTSAGKYEDADLQALKTADCVIIAGADLVNAHKVAGFFVKRNLLKGTRLVVISPFETEMDDLANCVLRPNPGSDESLFEGLMAGLVSLGLDKAQSPDNLTPVEAASHLTGVPVEALGEASRIIGAAERPVFVYGKGLTQHSDAKALQALHQLAEMVAGSVVSMKGKANSQAAQVYGLNSRYEADDQHAVYLALGDDGISPRMAEMLEGAPFLAVQASYASPVTEMADVVLPVTTWSEQGGHYVNLEGRLQAAQPAVLAGPQVRSNLDAIQCLAERLGARLDGAWEEALTAHRQAAV